MPSHVGKEEEEAGNAVGEDRGGFREGGRETLDVAPILDFFCVLLTDETPARALAPAGRDASPTICWRFGADRQ